MKVFLLLTLFIASLRAYDGQLKGPGLAIDLISETRSVSPGRPFTLGLHLHHFAGFHSYWKNPGIVGVATSIEWTLPAGFTASEISWPHPENSFMGPYPCHGYERPVTLLVTITPPAELVAPFVTLRAKAQWMCCAKGCFPGLKSFDMTLPVSAEPIVDPTAQALIKKALSELPTSEHQLHATLLNEPDAPLLKMRLSGLKKTSPAELYFFSSDGQISSDQTQKFSLQDDGSWLFTVPRSEFSPKGASSLPGVLKIAQQYFSITAHLKK